MDERFHGFERTVEDWHWWYRVRRDILDQMIAGLALPPGARLLDVGCGTGGTSLVLSRYGVAVGMDRAPQSFALSRERPYSHRVVGDLGRPLPFADGSFDVVCALDILEHIEDDFAAVRELTRICKPGGHVIAFVPAFQALWGYNDEYSHHRRRYRAPELTALLTEAGLEVADAGYFNLVLFLPTLVARVVQRRFPRWSDGMEHGTERTLLNDVLAKVFHAELPLLKRVRLPAGTSAFALGKKPG